MAIKKSELYSSLWASCDELRSAGSMDPSQYKDYVLVMLFVKYISDRFANVPYATIKVPPGSTFQAMVALKGSTTIGDDINKKILGPIAEANKLSEMPDFNNPDKLGSGKVMVETLTKLIAIFENPALDFRGNRAEGDDILGDAYEYLMRHFATLSGKSKGEFYTPAEVSRVMAKIIGINAKNSTSETSVYDPTCGSGSLLLKVADEAEKLISVFGQEKESTTAGLARMNMILHNHPTAIIKQGNTLADPQYEDSNGRLKTFDFVVANPPFSSKSWSNGVNIPEEQQEGGRFYGYGVPPAKNGDYAFLLHILKSLKSKGKAAVILPLGVLFRGNAEAEIRQNLIRSGVIKGIISLPANLFYGTGIPACLIVLDKENKDSRKGIFMVDAGKGFVKEGNKNRLREQDIHKIVDVFNKQLEIPKYSRMVSLTEIEEKEFNLNIPRYIDSSEAEDIQNIEAHLQGDIPNADIDALQHYWKVYPTMQKHLFEKSSRANFSKLKIAKEDIKQNIFSHPEFVTYNEKVNEVFTLWKNKNTAVCKAIDASTKPKKFIHSLSENLLDAFSNLQLIDKYDVYQHLMTYWVEAMQDDCYLIVRDTWKAGNEVEWTKKEFEGKLIPKGLLINRYFAAELKAIEQLEADRDALTAQLEEMEEENSGGEDVLNNVGNKTDANKAYQDYIELAWKTYFEESFKKYEGILKQITFIQNAISGHQDNAIIQSLRNNKGNITKKAIKDKLKVAEISEQVIVESYLENIKSLTEKKKEAKQSFESVLSELNVFVDNNPEAEFIKEIKIILLYIKLCDDQTEANKKLKEAKAELDKKLLGKYTALSEAEIKQIVVEDKWIATIEHTVKNEMQRISQRLTQRIKELAERYETPLPTLRNEVSQWEEKVNAHLTKMGFVWS